MWRSLHSVSGLIGMLLIAALALSGAWLSAYPVIEGFAPEVQPTLDLSVADAAGSVSRKLPDMESLSRSPSGTLVASYSGADGVPRKAFVNAETGDILRTVEDTPTFKGTLTNFHRSLFLGQNGRIVVGLGAAMLIVLSISGVFLLVYRMGGVTQVFKTPKGSWSQRYHTIITRLLIVPLVLSSLTGLYIVLTEFDLIAVTRAESTTFPQSAQKGLPAVSPGTLHGLDDIPLDQLISLKFPLAGDPADVFTATTTTGLTVVDQFTGDVLERVPATGSEILYNSLYAMHTGEGMAWLGMFLGFAALLVPVIATTGAVIWWKRVRSGSQIIRGNQPAPVADIVVLVGSEGGTTWGFARSLHRELTRAGRKVHVASMNAFSGRYQNATQLLFLTATYGNGNAPESACRFQSLLADLAVAPNWRYAVLGFGDRAFPHFCKYAKDLDADLENHGWQRNVATAFINRQSTQAFSTWGADIGSAIGAELTLSHQVELPTTQTLTLAQRHVYGEAVQSPTAVLRLRHDPATPPKARDRLLGRGGKHPHFAPGDLLGVLPPGSEVPRYYSVSSTRSSTEVEICVRKQTGGECSGFLHGLTIGEQIQCFVRTNPLFQMVPGNKPVIMVSAGTGIAPFIGMIRGNHEQREIHLFWGGRHPDSDYLYEDDLAQAKVEKRLSSSTTAFSRVADGAYVQQKVKEHAARLEGLLRRGASVMVCGGDAMAQAVMTEFETIAKPMGLSVMQLKSQGLYLEDIY